MTPDQMKTLIALDDQEAIAIVAFCALAMLDDQTPDEIAERAREILDLLLPRCQAQIVRAATVLE